MPKCRTRFHLVLSIFPQSEDAIGKISTAMVDVDGGIEKMQMPTANRRPTIRNRMRQQQQQQQQRQHTVRSSMDFFVCRWLCSRLRASPNVWRGHVDAKATAVSINRRPTVSLSRKFPIHVKKPRNYGKKKLGEKPVTTGK